MKISDLLKESRIVLNIQEQEKKDIFKILSERLKQDGMIHNKDPFLQALWEREKQGTTGIGDGIAIPHGRSSTVTQPALAFCVSRKGIHYDSLDGGAVHIVFMIAVP